ncbi:MAG: translation initiation factor IF-2 [Chitinophagales bacterium]
MSPPEIELAGPKVIGKIDLSGTNWKTRPDKKRKRKERKRRVKPGTEGEKNVGSQQDGVKQDGDERQIKERPKVQLKGPTVIGKIDLSAKQDKKEGEESTEGGLRPKRRRRKRIIKSTDKKVAIKKSDQPGGTKTRTPNEKTLRVKKRRKKKPHTSGNRNIEATEVSAKEIQDKIKATMAKLSGTSKGKSNRAKLRKQKREQAAIKRDLVEDTETNVLSVTEFISVNEFAKLMDVAVNKVITTCFNLGIIVSINQRLDAEVIELVADEFGFETEFINVTEQDEEEDYFNDAEEDLEPRAPVVTVMGHVDHGKTSLLDYIRNANVIAGEMGGITQHIGAYEVTTESGKEITFLDTPGHEAFTAMRARGAKVTDIAVIVIAADDDIMPQTKEAISHAQAANVPMIFAINKVDKSTALPEKIKEQLAAMNLLVEDWGGQYQSQEISAKFGTNVDELLEKILLEAELLELKANPNREAIGTVLEASLDKGRGYVSNILVQNGSLKVGDMVLAGQHVGKVKAMFNERGNRVKTKVGPATPVTILGLNGAPQAGDRVKVMKSEQEAKSIATKRAQIIREQGFRASKHITLEEIGRRLKIGTFKELNLIVKGDMDGSVEALTDSLLKLSTEEIRVNVIHRGVGAITESDVLLASASDAIIVGFQVRPTINARRNAEQESIEIRTYSIIYDAIEEIKSAMEGMLEPKVEERFVCNIEVREAFKISKVGTVAGCYVAVGKVTKATRIHLLRDGIIVFTGEIETLKRFKDDVKEALPGQECGIRIKNYNDIKAGDVIEGFEEIEIKRTL